MSEPNPNGKPSTMLIHFPPGNTKEEWSDNRTRAYNHLCTCYYGFKSIMVASGAISGLAALIRWLA